MITLIDAHAELHRAHHAPMSDLTAPGGQPTKALYLFLRLVYKYAVDEGHDVTVCWDTPRERLVRRRLYPDYKANRKERTPGSDDGLHSQMALAKKILTDAGVVQARSIGWEADDVIAALCRRERRSGRQVQIIGRDKDLHQCLRDGVVMVNSSTGEITTHQDACVRWGVESVRQIVELQTLIGDTTDNVPGVPGVGPVTALKLIKRYGTAFNVLGHAGEQSPALAKALSATDYDLLRKMVKLNTRCRLQVLSKHKTVDFTRAKRTLDRLYVKHLDA